MKSATTRGGLRPRSKQHYVRTGVHSLVLELLYRERQRFPQEKTRLSNASINKLVSLISIRGALPTEKIPNVNDLGSVEATPNKMSANFSSVPGVLHDKVDRQRNHHV